MSSFGGGGGSSGPTPQQVALQNAQTESNAQLNLQENETRKVQLNALQGTRVFRGSALTRSAAGNSAATATPFAPPASANQTAPIPAPIGASLIDNQVPGSSAPGSAGSAISLISGPGAGGTGRIPSGPGRIPVGQA